MNFQTVNPATGRVNRGYQETGQAEWSETLERAHAVFLKWRTQTIAARAEPMRKLAKLFKSEARALAALAAEEMGKPLAQGIAEAEKCGTCCDYYAENAERFLARQDVYREANKRAFVSFQPIGIVLAVMPWNFPFWQVVRFAAPALMAGNAAMLKHASNVPGCALALEKLILDAGFPRHLFNTVLVPGREVEKIIKHPRVRAVTLTGSTPAGRQVAVAAGAELKKVVLELGGSDAYLVLPGVDLDDTAGACARGRLVNGGQSCIAAKRFIVLDSIKAEFERLLCEKMSAFAFGDPMNEKTALGPMARHDLRDELHKQVEMSIARGAKLLCGGKIPDHAGAYYPPTVLSDVKSGMPAFDEEMFGPVASVISASSVEEAIEIANGSPFGLGGGVFTADLALGERLAEERIEAGSVFVNDTVVSDSRLPFGGVKDSGHGRELSSFGMLEFVNIKTVVVAAGHNAKVSPSVDFME